MSEQNKPAATPGKSSSIATNKHSATPPVTEKGEHGTKRPDHEQGREHRPDVDATKKLPLTEKGSEHAHLPGNKQDNATARGTENTAGEGDRTKAKDHKEENAGKGKTHLVADSSSAAKH